MKENKTLLDEILEVHVSFVFMMILVWLCVAAGLIYLGIVI